MKTKVFIEIQHRVTGEVRSVEAVEQFFVYGEQFVIHRKLNDSEWHPAANCKWICAHAKTGFAVGCGNTRVEAKETAEANIDMNGGEQGLRKAISRADKKLGRKRS